MYRKIIWLSVLAGLGVPFHTNEAYSQNFSPKQITIIVGFPAGGGTDIFARLFGQKLAAALNTNVIIENRPGASSTIGAHAVARAQPNGQTLLFTSASLALSKALFKSLPFDPQQDLAPIAMTARIPFVLVVHPSVPVRNVKDLLALAKRRPGSIDFGSSGIGSAPHFAMEMLKDRAGVNINHIPYKGAGPNTIGQLSGEVQVSMLIPPVSQPHIQNGRMRGLAVSTRNRSSALPDLPSLQEAGVLDYDVPQWHGFLAPGKTPSAIISQLSAEIVKALSAADIKKRLVTEGADAASGTPAELATQLASDIASYTTFAQRLGLKLE